MQQPNDTSIQTVGIIGAGKLGIVLAQLSLRAGYDVLIAGSGDPAKIALTIKILAPGATAMTASEVARNADIIILALPLGRHRQLPADALTGKVVIDAMNYWWEVDGDVTDIYDPSIPSSVAVQHTLPAARIVKALSHMGYHDLYDEATPKGTPGRKAIAVAGNNSSDTQPVMELIDRLGFDPVYIGNLEASRSLEPGGPAFGANLSKDTLVATLDQSSARTASS